MATSHTDDEWSIHVIPKNDIREHDVTPKCWCRPVQDAEDSIIWVHNAMDERESYENGRKLH